MQAQPNHRARREACTQSLTANPILPNGDAFDDGRDEAVLEPIGWWSLLILIIPVWMCGWGFLAGEHWWRR